MFAFSFQTGPEAVLEAEWVPKVVQAQQLGTPAGMPPALVTSASLPLLEHTIDADGAAP